MQPRFFGSGAAFHYLHSFYKQVKLFFTFFLYDIVKI